MGDSSTAPFARLGRAVPAGGRRSKPSPRFCSGGDMRFRCAIAQRCRPEVGVPSRPCGSAQAAICGFAALSRSGAGRRPAFQAVPAVLLRRRCAVLRRYRAAVPAGGRRSKPSPRFCSGGDMRFRCAIAQRCRPEAGVPPPAARRHSCRSPPRGRRDRPGLLRAAHHRLRRAQARQGRELRDVERTKSWPLLWRPIRISGAARVPSVAPGGGQSIRR